MLIQTRWFSINGSHCEKRALLTYVGSKGQDQSAHSWSGPSSPLTESTSSANRQTRKPDHTVWMHRATRAFSVKIRHESTLIPSNSSNERLLCSMPQETYETITRFAKGTRIMMIMLLLLLQLLLLLCITKTRLYNFDPLKPDFYIVKLGFTGVYIIFLTCWKNIDCGYSLEPPR